MSLTKATLSPQIIPRQTLTLGRSTCYTGNGIKSEMVLSQQHSDRSYAIHDIDNLENICAQIIISSIIRTVHKDKSKKKPDNGSFDPRNS